ncbi:hypothetical protein O6H91_08G054100 [Diphasiastrum complanatum]|uniref:Uncharacterized protein n=1 Tax=Diphasiastrum complanatum TaxID=34168 RepID=A0ACC2CXM0_DIPCM|nr:hypothetical protein O6H91_08G054100 [Diphasiastrum complanatum]
MQPLIPLPHSPFSFFFHLQSSCTIFPSASSTHKNNSSWNQREPGSMGGISAATHQYQLELDFPCILCWLTLGGGEPRFKGLCPRTRPRRPKPWAFPRPMPTRRVKCRHQDTKPEGIDWNQKMKAGNIFTVHAYGNSIPNQAESVVSTTTAAPPEYKSLPDLDYLQELLAIQQQGPRAIGFFGTRNMGFMHQQLIEVLSYAMVITNNHIYTSGASGTNAAVIRGALRAERPDLLTVILPQSLKMQPPESQELLAKVQNLVEMPHNDELPLIEASRLCNMDILSHVQQVICFAFHDSKLLMETCSEAKNLRKIVTLFYLD